MLTEDDGAVDGFVIAETEFGTFAIPRESAHRWPARTVLSGRRWEPETTDAICQHASGGDVIHAGAFFGDALPAISLSLSQQNQRAMVLSFEPNPASFLAAKKTVELNGLRNVVLYDHALGSQFDWMRLLTHDATGDALGSISRLASEGVEVRVVTIDEIAVATTPRVIHLDLEGWELPALDGAIRTINRCLPTLILEARRGTGADPYLRWCADNVLGTTYRLTREVEGNVILEAG